MAKDWRSIVVEKRSKQLLSIPKEWLIHTTQLPGKDILDVTHFPESCGLLTGKEIDITNSTVKTLLSKMANSEWSSFEVTTAFYKRAIIAHQLVNCLTEIFVERALARAKEVDEYLVSTGKVMGPLHGLPISLKDQINIQGIEATMGYISWVDIYADKNSVLVDTLESLGAVPFVKTAVPQTLMWGETFNNIFGRTLNPWNITLTPGGSSGGEGALIALKGSPIGIGSDIGGSIRIPAGFCGLYGLRPSAGRVPYSGCVNSLQGQDSVQSVLGPIANSLNGVHTFMKAVVDAQTWHKDPLVVPKPWNEEEYQLINHGGGKNLCFGIMWDDGVVVPQPPIIRGLNIVKNALIAAGHTVVDWKPLKHSEIVDVTRKIWYAGDMEDYQTVAQISGEPIVGSMLPETLDKDGYNLGERFMNDGISTYQTWQIQKQRQVLRKDYLDHWEQTVDVTGTSRPIDAIICPVAPYSAPPHGYNKITQYTTVWNGLDYTSLVVPVTKVDESLDLKESPHQFYGEADQMNYEFYEPAKYCGAPVAVQLVGRTLEEEAVLGMAEIVDAAVKSYTS